MSNDIEINSNIELDNLENKCETETITGIIKYSENSNYEKINIKFDENSTFKNLGIHEKIKIKKSKNNNN